MRTRTLALTLALLAASLPALAESAPRDEAGPRKPDSARQELYNELDEARLNVELLELEYQGLKDQLKRNLQMARMYTYQPRAFGMGGMEGGMKMGGLGGNPKDLEGRREEMLDSTRNQIARLREDTLTAGRELRREQRRANGLERQLGETSSAPDESGVERRLEGAERKLDQILDLLRESKDRR